VGENIESLYCETRNVNRPKGERTTHLKKEGGGTDYLAKESGVLTWLAIASEELQLRLQKREKRSSFRDLSKGEKPRGELVLAGREKERKINFQKDEISTRAGIRERETREAK